MNELDTFLSEDNGNINIEIVKNKTLASKDLFKNLVHKESLLRQKYRMDWLKEGDYNFRLFHNVMKERHMRNFLDFINTD